MRFKIFFVISISIFLGAALSDAARFIGNDRRNEQIKSEPKLRVSSADIKDVRATWKGVFDNAEKNGVIILKTFLDKYNYYDKFKKFKGVPHEDIDKNLVFRRHCKMIMDNLDVAISLLDKPNELKPLLTGLGKGHAKRGINKKQFEELRDTILGILKDKFGVNEKQGKAWKNVMDAVVEMVGEGLEKIH